VLSNPELKALDAGTASIPESDHDLAFGVYGVKADRRRQRAERKQTRRSGARGTWHSVQGAPRRGQRRR